MNEFMVKEEGNNSKRKNYSGEGEGKGEDKKVGGLIVSCLRRERAFL